ncbi:glycoside hydrolase family 88 protein [Niallia alba]|uniref:Glycoside hydrolase family 88 protein n=1 Tax=Niallia circulans TaxID=1397 RepID=A0A941GCC4_NIACI|nr:MULTISPECIES: glycoside hydrolase family 88 protein [Niallia]MCB5237514.1 glycoside hydrolase family 88 protein [Niallia circulans]MDU1845874.1 glycoside hydrolase family 88 protein [Niallia nealsonii]MED3794212.1 glycoside hydrolase family 88 protein [Niallia alba]
MGANEKWLVDAWEFVVEKSTRNNETIGANFPHASVDKKYVLESPEWWTAGFWPGLLWQVYQENKDEALRKTAEQCEEKLDYLLSDSEKLDHDMGFMWTLTSLANYKLTGNKESRRRGLLAANLLLGRFNAQGNYIRAWNAWSKKDDNRGVAIIDCMMNLPLLYWASAETGDPRFKIAAEKHAETVLKHFIRPDGSVHHIVVFDSETGEVVDKLGGQGYAPDSAWSRGTAWALYGMTLSYLHTNNIEFLHAAKSVSHFFLSNLRSDECPAWDFRIPADGEKKYHYPDSSAGSIAACGLLILGTLVTDFEKPIYQEAGANLLKTLYTTCATQADKEEEGLLNNGTSHFPEQKNVDVPLIYGDYYFVEGLNLLREKGVLFWQ